MNFPPVLVALSLLASLHCPVRAQNENTIILDEFRMKLLKPSSYTRTPKDEVYPVVLSLQSPAIERYSSLRQKNSSVLSYKLLGGIILITMPKPKTGLEETVDNALPTDSEIEGMSKIIPGIAIQKKVKIKVAGRDALSVLASLDVSQALGIQEEASLRLIYMVYKNTRMIWLFAGMNADFETSVKDFEKTINSIRFLDDKPLKDDKPVKPTIKTTPKTPATKGGKGKG